MSFWFWHGLRNGIRTTGYPRVPETATGVSPGRPLATEFASAGEAATATAVCPTGAIVADGKTAAVVLGKCVHCQRCRFGLQQPVAWGEDYEWTTAGSRGDGFEPLPVAYRRSTHIMVVDAADCGACLREVKQLNNPFYNMHRRCTSGRRPGERKYARAFGQDLRSDAGAQESDRRGNMRDYRGCVRANLRVRRRSCFGVAGGPGGPG